MRGFPNRMLYPDFKLRYSCLGQDAIKSSSDNKTAVWALMDGIPFDRERYRLGHTLVFFRAGSLGALEEERDKLVIKWVRMIQGEVLKRVRSRLPEEVRPEGADQGRPEELPQVPGQQGLGMVCSHPED